ncbi:MAG: tRNA preQ1(34) S-adenosylmethionine ribosyltransferase-isomerase QueA [Treponema sp.]|nr:tRNA preQ1(34) S-adenosylmethionine ribosyltransferase-isomerase QueA [Treponema sp.]MCL2181447.1 tRNA preQ1(34) S-adenosylmethionine ribosyltransferase-isomerase QueA [Treponema sp.]
MKTEDFNFYLPENLIAQYPPAKRGQSRLMALDRVTGKIIHSRVSELSNILCNEYFLSPRGEKPLLIFNDTKVRKARLYGKALESGASVEFLLLEKVPVNMVDNIYWKCLVQRAKRRKIGSKYIFNDSDDNEIAGAEITEEKGEFRYLKFDRPIDDDFLDRYGHIPLPPYIKRADTSSDAQRYQTIYARNTGSAAAPTAGLHFTSGILDELKNCGIKSAFVTLHVGLGTFLPVRSVNIEDHKMHEESFFISEENAALIEKSIEKKIKIIAVGTTSLRTLESAACEGSLERALKRGWQKTSIFIYPGYKFKVIDALFTNFHTPLSTLLMLTCAFAGRELILDSYAEAVREGYRFFSYGDAMLIY